ncbi:MAG: MerR family DNA-binding transcriptional regulator [Candidatus Paceibacterota bacterium]|jgi:DNA-binding transcriptional MerR regulator|nr:MerR family transcriptional regulator [Candidatus Paceibacterota bacterium]
MNEDKIRIGEAAKILGVTTQTLRNWERSGKIVPERSVGKQRYYSLETLNKFALDIQKLGLAWSISAIPPDLPSEYYCERADRFTSRLSKMGEILLRTENVSQDLASLITLVVGEIGDNSFAHNIGNWPDATGIFYAYDFTKRIIVLADRGRGIKATLQQIRPSISTDLEALTVAFTEVISGRNPEKRGNGLKVVRRVLESNEINFIFRSGIGLVSIFPSKKMEITMADNNIRGTYCVIIF